MTYVPDPHNSYYVDWIDANVKVSLINAQAREHEKLKEQTRFKSKLGNPFQVKHYRFVFFLWSIVAPCNVDGLVHNIRPALK